MEENVCLSQEAEPPGQQTGMTGLALDELIQNTLPSSPVAPATTGITSRVFIMPSRGATTCKPSPRSQAFRKQFFPEATAAEWNDWRWQVRNRITGVEMLSRILWLSPDEEMAIHARGGGHPAEHHALLCEPAGFHGFRSAPEKDGGPGHGRAHAFPWEKDDPLGEDHDSPVPGLVHRYPDRVLFLVTEFCSTYCRYCTRSRIVGHGRSSIPQQARWEAAIHYIESTPSVRDVLLSGGDPLTLPDTTSGVASLEAAGSLMWSSCGSGPRRPWCCLRG